MADYSYFRLQFTVFALVSASFTNIYINQPVLPVLQSEFSADMVLVSFSFLADRLPIHQPLRLRVVLPVGNIEVRR